MRSSPSTELLIDANRLMSDSVLRAGAEVSFSTQQGALISNFAVSCDKTPAWLLFSTRSGERVYPGAGKRFGDRRQLTESAALQIKAIPAVQAACKAAPDWREVARNDGVVTLVDINNIKAVGDEAHFWGAFDYPNIGLDLPYQAPFGQKFERFSLSCKKQSYAQLSGYDIDQRNRVTDGLVFGRPTREQVGPGTNPDYKALFASVCGNPSSLSRLPVFVPREKAPLATSIRQEPIPAVMQNIAQLNLLGAPKRLKRLVLDGTYTFEGKTRPSRQETVFRASTKPGLLSIEERGEGYVTSDLSFLGLLNITRETLFTDSGGQSHSVATEAVFSGDWRRMPLGSEVGYSVTANYLSDMTGTMPLKNTTQCKVIAESEASKLHAALTGIAKQLECRGVNDKHKQILTAYFLQDYGFIVQLESSKTSFSYFSRTIKEVEQ
jgi:hypothetical protein